jgi:hypothetical protein
LYENPIFCKFPQKSYVNFYPASPFLTAIADKSSHRQKKNAEKISPSAALSGAEQAGKKSPAYRA